jgi:hypothetical protein
MNNPLFGRFDVNPGRYRPQFYHVEIDVPVNLNGVGRGSITINNQPYALTRITHKLVGNVKDPEASGLFQDGMYDVEWKDEQSSYVDGPIAADLMWGWNHSGYVLELPFPIPYAGAKTLSFVVTNRVARTLIPEADTFPVQICLHGVGDWGELAP